MVGIVWLDTAIFWLEPAVETVQLLVQRFVLFNQLRTVYTASFESVQAFFTNGSTVGNLVFEGQVRSLERFLT